MSPGPAERTPPAGAPEIVLVLPGDHHLVSGGNLFNAGLLEGLAAIGHPHRALGLDEATAFAATGVRAAFVLDSVLLPRAAELRSRLRPGQGLHLLAHHLPVFEPWNRTPAIEAATRRDLAGFDGFLAGSAHAAGLLEPWLGDRPVAVIPPALAVRPRGIAPAGSGFRGLVVASLIRVKGVRPLLEALARGLAENDDLRLDVVGRDDLEPEEARACERLVSADPRLARAVTLHGPVPAASMPGWYERSSVLVSASEHETFGMALHEARAFGLPILALDRAHARPHVPTPAHGRLLSTLVDLIAVCLKLSRDHASLAALRRAAFDHRLPDARTWADSARSLGVALLSSPFRH